MRTGSDSIFALLLVAGAAFAAYVPALANGFVWLDHTEIVGGLRIVHSWSDLGSVFFRDDQGFTGYHRPFYNLLHSLDFHIWGLAPFGFHLTSVLLHVVNVALIWKVLGRFGVNDGRRPAMCLLWSLHPVNTAAVGLIHARSDLFVTTALALTVWCASYFQRSARSAGWVAASCLAFGVAVLTKETALMLPLVAAALVWTRRGAVDGTRAYVVWIGVCVIESALTLFPRLAVRPGLPLGTSLSERLLTFIGVYNDYVFTVLLPNKLFIGDTVTRYSALPDSAQVSTLAIATVLLGVQAFAWFKAPWSRPWLLIWNAFLVPVSQLVPILHFRADRFLYLPSLGLIGFAVEASARAVATAGRQLAWPRLAMGLFAGVLAASYGVRTATRLGDFANDERLFAAELSRVPDYREGLSALALAYDRKRQYARADSLWRAALEPSRDRLSYVDKAAAITNYSANLLAQGRFQEAYTWLESRLVEITDPATLTEARYNQAVAASQLGRFDRAYPIFEAFVRSHPHDASAHYLLAWNAGNLGKRSQARAALQRYLELSPAARDRPRIESWLRSLE